MARPARRITAPSSEAGRRVGAVPAATSAATRGWSAAKGATQASPPRDVLADAVRVGEPDHLVAASRDQVERLQLDVAADHGAPGSVRGDGQGDRPGLAGRDGL